MTSENSSLHFFEPEDLVCGAAENVREFECKLEAGHIAVAFDRVDALAGHADRSGQTFLRPTCLFSQFANAVSDLNHCDKRTLQY